MSAGATLLAIDDEPGILAMVDRFAQRFGFEVVTRTDARAGLAEMPALKPAAVMVDLKMPEVNGLDVLRAIRDIDPTCQVILMTAHASVDTAIEALKLGALDYLSKPFDLDRLGDLLTTIRKSTERRERWLQVVGGSALSIFGHAMRARGCASTRRRNTQLPSRSSVPTRTCECVSQIDDSTAAVAGSVKCAEE